MAIGRGNEARLSPEVAPAITVLGDAEAQSDRPFDLSPSLLCVSGLDGAFKQINPSWTRVLGWEPEELQGTQQWELVHPDDRQVMIAAWEQLARGEPIIALENRQRHKNGTYRWIEWSAYTLTDEELLFCVGRDITEQKQTEEALQESRRALATLMSNLPGMAYRCRNDKDWTMEFISDGCRELTGYESSDLLNNRTIAFAQLICADDRQPIWDDVQAAVAQGRPFQLTYRITTADGQEKWVWERGRGVLGADGQLVALEGFISDVTEQKRAEVSLRQSEERFALAMRGANEGLWDWDLESDTVYYSPHWKSMLGYAEQEIRDDLAAWRDLLHPDDRETALWELRARLETCAESHEVEFRMRHKDGHYVVILCRGFGVRNASGKVTRLVGTHVDISDRRRTEEALRQQIDELFTIFNSIDGAVYVADVETYEVLAVNEHLETHHGPNLIGKHCYEVFQAGRTSPCPFCTNEHLVAADGTPNPPVVWEFQNTKTNRWYHCIDRVIHWPNGRLARMEIAFDITKRKQAEEEKEKLEAQLRHAQKMEAVGQLAGGVAHDFNNILTSILGHVELSLDGLKAELPEDTPLLSGLREIERAAHRAAALTRQLLIFSRRDVARPDILDLNQTIGEMEKMLRRLVSEDIALEFTPALDLHPVRADSDQIGQVIVNLVINSRDAMPCGGELRIETSNVILDETYVANCAEARQGPHVMVVVSDTGCGMSKETVERIFEPFFTTKPSGQGTGLGLATVYGIIKQAGGHILPYSELGRGTTFRIYLPAVAVPAMQRRSSSPGDRARTGTETILLCEDDETVRLLAVRVLRDAGYNVLVADDSAQALDLAAEYGRPIQLLVTDVIMPGMNGKNLAQALRAMQPELRTLFVSGYTASVLTHQGVLDEGVEFLAKPFNCDNLLHHVREVLDKPSPVSR